jgi:hypothetical protein
VLLITTHEEAENRLITKVIDVSDLVVCRDTKGEHWDDYNTLTDMIASTIKPTSWDQVGGAASIVGASFGKAKVVVISQTYDVHQEIAKLLAEIRMLAKKSPDGELPRRDKPTDYERMKTLPQVFGDPSFSDISKKSAPKTSAPPQKAPSPSAGAALKK